MITALSLGAGVQSTTIALMAAVGELPQPDWAIFADTGDEKRGTYRYLDWLEPQLPFPLIRISRFNLTLSQLTLARYADDPFAPAWTPPFFYPGGMLPKQCSKEFKTRAISEAIRGMLGLRPKERGPRGIAAEVWIGISRDEAHRMKPSEVPWICHRYPLIDRMMRRGDCLRWLERHQFPVPPRSACVYCPFQSEAELADMRAHPEDDDWHRATAFDGAIRPGGAGTAGPLFVSDRRAPLDVIAFDRQRGLDLFGNHCDGYCGV